MIVIPAGRYGPSKAREVAADSLVRIDLRIPAWMARELTIRASQGRQSRNAYVEQLLVVELRRDRGDPGLPAFRDSPQG